MSANSLQECLFLTPRPFHDVESKGSPVKCQNNAELDPTDVVDQLQQLIDDVEAFCTAYLREMSTICQCDDRTFGSGENIELGSSQLAREKAAWEQLRRMQEAELAEKFEYLTDAWLRLEEEQRQFLQTKELHSARSIEEHSRQLSDTSNAVEVGQLHNDEPNNRTTSFDHCQDFDRDQQVLGAFDQPTDSALLQFQVLKREIEKLRPQRNRRTTT